MRWLLITKPFHLFQLHENNLTFPSRYLYTIGQKTYLALADWFSYILIEKLTRLYTTTFLRKFVQDY